MSYANSEMEKSKNLGKILCTPNHPQGADVIFLRQKFYFSAPTDELLKVG